MSDTPLLEVRNLKVHFPLPGTLLKPKSGGSVKAVDGVSFHLNRGETLGLVGESGCGKSTTGMAVLRMTPVTAGEIHLEGNNITDLKGRSLRTLRRKMQMIYQDPFGALDPRMRVLDIIGEPLKVHNLVSGRKAYRAEVMRLMELVGLLPGMAERYPHEFSGGQRQRIGIARALAARPEVIICDEPVSALDVSIQAQIINLLKDLQEELGLTYLFVAHDLAVVRHICDRVMVMYLGHVVEVADSEELYTNPQHPYTQALLSAIPIPDPRAESRREVDPSIEGEVPSPVNPPSGCPFHPRCKHAMETCRTVAPELKDTTQGHAVSCHLYEPTSAAMPQIRVASMA
ncbi:oligopeptide transport system ATP-binding protein [Marinobacter daqiaonensis]|uniref:ABC-type dipeptide transporter n=1 Tax=Marinobacter daqiaonensis TaxID=650891 RepID=A0A1I6I0L4_9GAMM|nr:oligopeptide/dipeptide ABC transporter ATP-binding protein [Marinobacter daqiaonensis]SFR60188.1 oligopeptide transport system ATP-binding protein [Marinobacter daqiaonensis]